MISWELLNSILNILAIYRNCKENLKLVDIFKKSKLMSYYRKKRIWKKKINYDCRKKVADNRLRIKGKFVTREQACLMLGIDLCS